MTSSSYFDKMNSTLGSVVPLAMFFPCVVGLFLSDSSSLSRVLGNTSPEVSSGSLGPRMEAALGESPQPEI